MLILSRRAGQTINIGDDVSITILENNHGQVRVGIAAPKSIAVHREEIRNRILKEKAAKKETEKNDQ